MDQNQLGSQTQKTIIDGLGLSDLSQEKQDELMAKMAEVILKRIYVETMEKLSGADKENYAKMIEEEKTPEEVENFLLEKIPAYDQMIKKIIDDFKSEMLSKQ